jgi:putative membrane protein
VSSFGPEHSPPTLGAAELEKPLDTATWHRLHPLSPVIRAGPILMGLVIVYSTTLISSTNHDRVGAFIRLGIGGLVIVFGVISWLVTRWRVEGGDLRIETGVLRRSSLRFPLAQIQAIDTVRPLLARVFGLAELRLRMGGSTGASGRLAYLTAGQADTVRAQLLALSRGVAVGGEEPLERRLLSVPTGRLVASILIGTPAVLFCVILVATIFIAVATPEALVGVVSSSGAIGFGLLTFLWRRLNGGYNLTVAEAPDGLRVRSGLLDTTAETIPSGRVQAVRMVEPLLWRPLGWCRLEVDVAGRQRKEGENAPESRQLRSVLPVGTRAEADWLLSRILPNTPSDRIRAPARARWKAPLRYRNLSWGHNETCAVTTTGRVARVTSWVPLTKVQSLRLVQGPLQRKLRLATIYLDTAGRSVHAAIRDRDSDEANAQLVELTALCRAARRADPRRRTAAANQLTPLAPSSAR